MSDPLDDWTLDDEQMPPGYCSLCGRRNVKYRVSAGFSTTTGRPHYMMRERCVTHEWPWWRRLFVSWHPWREGIGRVEP